MAKLKVHLSIGYPAAARESLIDVDDEELAACSSEEEREQLCLEYWDIWANDYIDGYHELID